MLCRVLEVTCSGFYAWLGRKPSLHSVRDVELKAKIENAFARGRGTYGSPRVHVELRNSGEHVGAQRVARLMAENGLRAAQPRNFRKTTNSDHRHPVAEDLLKRNFAPAAPDIVWATDITYVWTWEG